MSKSRREPPRPASPALAAILSDAGEKDRRQAEQAERLAQRRALNQVLIPLHVALLEHQRQSTIPDSANFVALWREAVSGMTEPVLEIAQRWLTRVQSPKSGDERRGCEMGVELWGLALAGDWAGLGERLSSLRRIDVPPRTTYAILDVGVELLSWMTDGCVELPAWTAAPEQVANESSELPDAARQEPTRVERRNAAIRALLEQGVPWKQIPRRLTDAGHTGRGGKPLTIAAVHKAYYDSRNKRK